MRGVPTHRADGPPPWRRRVSAPVDPDQLRALRTLRRHFGHGQVVEVIETPALEAESGEQGELVEAR